MSKAQKYDFKAIGQTIKAARLKRGRTRERLAQEIDRAPHYIMSIENKGLNGLTEQEYIVMQRTADGLKEAREAVE